MDGCAIPADTLTRKDCRQIFKDVKKDRALFLTSVQSIMQCEFSKDIINNLFRDAERCHNKIVSKGVVDLEKVVLSRSEGIPFEDIVQIDDKDKDEDEGPSLVKLPKLHRKRLSDCKNKTVLSRTDTLYDALKREAMTEDISVLQLAGRMLARSAWDELNISQCEQRMVHQIGMDIFKNGKVTITERLSPSVALTLVSDCELGRKKYTKMRKLIRNNSTADILPPWNMVNAYKESITPDPINLPAPYDGFRMPLMPAIQITFTQILETINTHSLPKHPKFNLKAGIDGSGNHRMYSQVGSEGNNMVMTMMAPISVIDTETGQSVWTCNNANSADVHRPLIIQTGKETLENLGTTGPLSNEMNEVEISGIPHLGNRVSVNIDFSCIDRKAADQLQGTNGSFCDLCVLSDKQCQDTGNIDRMFVTRNIDTAKAIFEMLADDNGNVNKQKGDYQQRQGVTHKPLMEKNIVSAQPLHGRLRGLDFHVKLITHLKAGLNPQDPNFWSESKRHNDIVKIKQAKKDIQDSLRAKPGGIKLDIPDGAGCGGTTTTGARRLMGNDSHGSRDHLVEEVPLEYRTKVKSILSRHSIALNVLNSKEKVINLEEFKTFCHTLYCDILTWFPGAHITPTVHKVLAHSWELISMNDDHGLGNYSEEGLEACNKLLRRIRSCLARKMGKEENQIDCIKRLWARSDPVSNSHRHLLLPYCSTCAAHGHGTRLVVSIINVVRKYRLINSYG